MCMKMIHERIVYVGFTRNPKNTHTHMASTKVQTSLLQKKTKKSEQKKKSNLLHRPSGTAKEENGTPIDSGDSRPDMLLSAKLPCRLRDFKLGDSLAGIIVVVAVNDDALDLDLPGGSGYTTPVGTGASA